jgi:hypothetical protein
MFRFTDRKRLQTHEWVINTTGGSWELVSAPSGQGLRIQQFDIDARLDAGLVVQGIKDAFERVLITTGRSPLRTERVGSDGEMAASLHKTLTGLTRREASDPDLWAYLCCFGCPQYVRWRWTTNKPSAMWVRYAGNIRRNALARLWWWAEVTHDSSKATSDARRYVITRDVQNRQSLMLYFGDCAFSGHPLLARVLCNLQADQSVNDDDQKKLCRSVNRLARVVCLDGVNSVSRATKIGEKAFSLSAFL